MNMVPLGDLVQAVEKIDPSLEFGDGTFTYVDIGSVSQITKAIEAPQTLPCSEAPSRARQVIFKDDVIVSTVRPNLNAVARVVEEYDGTIGSTGFSVLRPDREKLEPSYLYHWVRTPAFIEKMMSQATGQSYPAVSDKIVKASSIPLPPLEEQKRIAGILDQADALRRLRTRALAKLDLLEDAMLLECQQRGATKQAWTKFGDLAEKTRNSFCNGPFGSDLLKSELTTEGVPVIYIRDIASGRYLRKSEWHVSEDKAQNLAACAVACGDLLLSKVGDPPCAAAVYPDGEPPAIITQDVIRVRVDPEVASAKYLSAFFNTELGRKSIKPIIVQATRARVSLKDLKSLKLKLPSLDLQRQIAAQLDAVEAQRRAAVDAEAKSLTLFYSLQHRAFRGDL